MIVVTSKFIELLNANSRTFRMKLVNGSDEYTNILSLKWSAALPTYLSIGNAICTCVECKAVGVPISIKGANLKVYITVMGSNDEWVQIGTFKAEKPTLQNGVVSFSAYDVMNECSKVIFTHKLGTVTVGECYETVITTIQNEIGAVSYVPLSSSVASLKINADMLCGYDCRNVLAYIAGYLGCNCVVNNTGSIEMRGFAVCDYTLNDNRIAEPELDDGMSNLEFLACSVNGDTKLLYGNNGEGFEFICPIMTQERLEQIGATLCASTSAVNVYRSGKIKHILGDFRLQIGDVVSLEHDGEIHIIPISSIVFEFDGGLSADIEALPLAEASALSLADTLDFISKQNANKRITGITNYYLATSQVNNVTKYTTGWSDTVQAVSADKKYLWNYEVVTLVDGTSYETEPCIIGNFAENGSNGRGIKSITEYYLVTQTESTPSKTNFKPNVQTPTETLPFLWNYEKIEYTDDSTPYESDVRLVGVYGSDGKSFYTWVRYADDANGTNMSDSPSGKKYIGIATNKSTETESDKASDYKWSLIQGNDGRGVSKVETEYYLSTSDQYLSGDSWCTSAPNWVDGRYLWTRLATYYTDSEMPEYSDPIIDASWKKTTAVEAASKELNETLANALGLYVTELTVSGSKIRYYHSRTPLASCVEGDTILVLNAEGFGVCKSGWNGGNPQFTYGATFDGKAVWDILSANTIKADLIKAGKIKSIDGAKMHTVLDLDTGTLTFEGSNVILGIAGGNENDAVEAAAPNAGLALKNKSTEDTIMFTLDGLEFFTADDSTSYIVWMLREVASAIANGTAIDFSTRPNNHRSRIQYEKIQSKQLFCEEFYLFDSDSGNSATQINLRGMLESISALKLRIGELEEALGQQHTHTNASAVRENVIEATCTSGGSYDSVVYCATCGEEISRTRVTTSALGHSWKDATCIAPKTCTRCGATSGSALGHIDSDNDGYCDRCGGTELTITEGVETPVSISTEKEIVYLKFVPQNTGRYTFESLDRDSSDPDGFIYDANKVQIGTNADTATGGFSLTYDGFVAGTVYYLGVRLYSGTGTVYVKASYSGSSSGGGSSNGSIEITTNSFVQVYKNGVDITNSTNVYNFNIGDTAKLVALTPDNHFFVGWHRGDFIGFSTANPLEFTVTADNAGIIRPLFEAVSP